MEGTKKVIEIPDIVPVLPVRNTVLFPNAAVPLIVGRPRSVQTVRYANDHGQLLLVVAQKDASIEEPAPRDIYQTGVVCLISKLNPVENDGFQLIANGLFRFSVTEFVEGPDFFGARGLQIQEFNPAISPKRDTLTTEIKGLAKAILSMASIPGGDSLLKLFAQLEEGGQIADLCATFLNLPIAVKQDLLETVDVEVRLEKLLTQMIRERDKLQLYNEIQTKMMERISKDQRDHLLREQLRTIHDELGDESNLQNEFQKKLEAAKLPPEAKKVAQEELARLNVVPRSSPEYHVIRTYLDWLCSLPWEKRSATDTKDLSLEVARKILDEDHFGLEKVKSRVLQFLAVRKLKKDLKGPVLCLLGPPGVGKTSMARSIARALGRSFIRASLGGVRDEAEIRGHRRTYIGALPGRILQNLKRCGVKDPLLLLDEIDKVGADFRGDPAAALLEVLDPEQNHNFLDHYLDVPFDLSEIFFVTTANVLETIPAALRDRLEIIEMSSYTRNEKLEITLRHLIPRLVLEHGLTPEQLIIPKEVISEVIDSYTREAGVRNLSRELSQVCRAAAEKFASAHPPEKVSITVADLDVMLGPPRFFVEEAAGARRPGISTGLAWTPVGGEILHIEVSRVEGRGNLILTGQLGEVMKESAQIGLSLLRSWWGKNFPFKYERSDFHIHVPAGAIPKDGPSAGVALFLALESLVEGKAIDSKFAMTGEITLQGNILPVGGIKEKVLAAHRAGLTTLCLPERNRKDLPEIPEEIQKTIRFHFVKNIREVLPLVGLVGGPIDPLAAQRSITEAVVKN